MIRFTHKSGGSSVERGRIAALVSGLPIFHEFHEIDVALTVHPALPEPAEVATVHTNWRRAYLAQVETRDPLPRQELDYVCPRGSRLVEVEFIRRQSGGMGNHYGFEGFFLSLIIAPDLQTVIDARGEQAH